jgi:hypothetical protein
MSIKKTLTDVGTDVPMAHHVVSTATVQWENNQTYVVVRSFFSQESYAASKRALAETPVMLMGIPARNADLIDWIQGQLVLPVDASISVNTYVNRWQFSGGEIVDHAPQADTTAEQPAPTPTPTPTQIPSPTDVTVEAPVAASDDSSATQTSADAAGAAASDSGTAATDASATDAATS